LGFVVEKLGKKTSSTGKEYFVVSKKVILDICLNQELQYMLTGLVIKWQEQVIIKTLKSGTGPNLCFDKKIFKIQLLL
jgi:endonuclease I